MLKTIRFSRRTLAVGYSSLSAWMVSKDDRSNSRYQDFSCSSQSECFIQKSRNVRFAITLTLDQGFTKDIKTYQIGNYPFKTKKTPRINGTPFHQKQLKTQKTRVFIRCHSFTRTTVAISVSTVKIPAWV